VGILVTFVPPKVTARRGMSDMPSRGTAATPKRTAVTQKTKNAQRQRQSPRSQLPAWPPIPRHLLLADSMRGLTGGDKALVNPHLFFVK